MKHKNLVILFIIISTYFLSTCTTFNTGHKATPLKNQQKPIPMDYVIHTIVYIPEVYAEFIYSLCVEYNVPFHIVVRLLQKESNFKSDCISYNKNGTFDSGIAQINSDYLEYFEWKYNMEIDPMNPYQSIEFVVKHLARLYRITDDWYLTACAYNAGITRVLNNDIPESSKRYAGYIVKGI